MDALFPILARAKVANMFQQVSTTAVGKAEGPAGQLQRGHAGCLQLVGSRQVFTAGSTVVPGCRGNGIRPGVLTSKGQVMRNDNGGLGNYRDVNLAYIRIDESYQRDVQKRCEVIYNDLKEPLIGSVLIGERSDGSLWLVDGRQRVTALKKLKKKSVHASIFKSNGPQHEAEMFIATNQQRTKVSSYDSYRARLVARDEAAIQVDTVVRELGFTIAKSRDNKRPGPSKVLTCPGALLYVVDRTSASLLRWILSFIKRRWPGDPEALRDRMITGLLRFRLLIVKPIDDDRLYNRLEGRDPVRIYREAAKISCDGGEPVAAAVTMIIKRLYEPRRRGKKVGK